MSLLDGELVQCDDLNSGEIHRPERFLQIALINLFDRAPMQAEVLSNVTQREHLGQTGHILGQAPGHAPVTPQPVQMFQLGATARTSQPTAMYQ